METICLNHIIRLRAIFFLMLSIQSHCYEFYGYGSSTQVIGKGFGESHEERSYARFTEVKKACSLFLLSAS